MKSDRNWRLFHLAVLKYPRPSCWEGLHELHYAQPGATLTMVPGGSTLPEIAGKEKESMGLAQSGQDQSLPSETREAICLLYQVSFPTHWSTAICHDLFMLPLLTASRYKSPTSLEANYHTNCQRQKTPPDCCPTSTRAYKSLLNKTAQNKQNCNSAVYTTLRGNDLSKVSAFARRPSPVLTNHRFPYKEMSTLLLTQTGTTFEQPVWVRCCRDLLKTYNCQECSSSLF